MDALATFEHRMIIRPDEKTIVFFPRGPLDVSCSKILPPTLVAEGFVLASADQHQQIFALWKKMNSKMQLIIWGGLLWVVCAILWVILARQKAVDGRTIVAWSRFMLLSSTIACVYLFFIGYNQWVKPVKTLTALLPKYHLHYAANEWCLARCNALLPRDILAYGVGETLFFWVIAWLIFARSPAVHFWETALVLGVPGTIVAIHFAVLLLLGIARACAIKLERWRWTWLPLIVFVVLIYWFLGWCIAKGVGNHSAHFYAIVHFSLTD